jgi:hypothetical protein
MAENKNGTGGVEGNLFCGGVPIGILEEEEISQEDLFAWADWSPEATIEEYSFRLVAAAAIANMERYYERPISIKLGKKGAIIWEHGAKKTVSE